MDTRLRLLTFGVFCGMVILVVRLYQVQVKEGPANTEKLRSQTTVAILLPPARGAIVDRNGLGLAENKASIDIDLNLRELVGTYSRNRKGRGVPKTAVPGHPDRQMVDVAKIVDSTTHDVVESLGFGKELTARDILRHYYQKPNVSLQIARNIDFSALSKFAEHNVNVPGLQEMARPVRSYNFGALAAHLLGYVGQMEEVSDADYVPDAVGKGGVEESMDGYLQGIPGGKILRKSNVGYILGVDAVRQPTVGDTVYLSIDARIQQIVEQEMRAAGVGRGACVVMDPNNGDILALVSVPSYDPNIFIPKVDASEWKRLNTDPTRPLFNRALNPYATGSTFKVITAMAALKNKKCNFTPGTVINSPSAVWLGGRFFKDWPNNPGEGDITLKTALAWSTNTFFYQLGVRTGIESMEAMAKLCGMGERLLMDEDGNPLVGGESTGQVPGPDWMQAQGEKKIQAWRDRKKLDPKSKEPVPYVEKWSDGHTANTSIGQGYVEVTPLQLANMMCAVANGGTVYYPRIVTRVLSVQDGKTRVIKEYPVRKKADLELDAKSLQGVREGLRAVVDGGTGKRANIADFNVAGKTGTAQFKARIHGNIVSDQKTWFNSFAPYEKPRYVCTLLVEAGVAGGMTCAPIVAQIYHRIAEMEKGTPVDMVYLTPSIGHFQGVSAIAAPADSGPPMQEQTPDVSQPMDVPDEVQGGASQAIQNIMKNRRR